MANGQTLIQRVLSFTQTRSTALQFDEEPFFFCFISLQKLKMNFQSVGVVGVDMWHKNSNAFKKTIN